MRRRSKLVAPTFLPGDGASRLTFLTPAAELSVPPLFPPRVAHGRPLVPSLASVHDLLPFRVLSLDTRSRRAQAPSMHTAQAHRACPSALRHPAARYADRSPAPVPARANTARSHLPSARIAMNEIAPAHPNLCVTI